MHTIDLTASISQNERILWQGKPLKKAFMLRSFVNPMLPVAIVWIAFDLFFFRNALTGFGDGSGASLSFAGFLIPFFLLHLMPVWMYLGGVIFSFLRYRNTNYLVTDRSVYFSRGVITITVDAKPLMMLSNLSIRRGIIERALHCGSIFFDGVYAENVGRTRTQNQMPLAILYIPDCDEVFSLIKEQQRLTYTDAQYPNDKR